MTSKVKLAAFNPNHGLSRGAPKIKEIAWYAIKVLFFLTAIPYPSFVKVLILKAFGAQIGARVILKPRINIHFPWKLIIGNDVWVGEEVFILNFETVTIGNNVCVSQRSFLCGGNHDYRQPNMPYRNGEIFLADGAWVGASSFIGPSVVIGEDSVITAGSIVTKSVEGNGVYRGNPAEFIKKRW